MVTSKQTYSIVDVEYFKSRLACTIRSNFIDQDPNITIDMVKNYANGKIKLYKFEFPIGTYSFH
jgi:hypothetical protein